MTSKELLVIMLTSTIEVLLADFIVSKIKK
jgi:hypothetical protein